jgi:uncharacterized membrane protein YbaN (DUF454 family)
MWSSPMKKTFLLSTGILSFILGVLGIALPLLPSTPFILLAGWCFMQSSPKFHQWLLRHPYFGVQIKNWKEKKAISKNTKIIALAMIVCSMITIYFISAVPVVKIVMMIILSIIFFVVLRLSHF